LASRVTHVLHFTFIELLVVVSIVAIIASLLIPTRASARAKAKLTACAGNLKVLGGAQQSYLNDHGGKVVSGWDGDVADQAERTFWTKIKRYYGDEFLRECPANPQDKLECYGLYSALSGKQLSTTVAKPTGTVLMGENTQLDLESYRRDIEYWTRAGTGHWELGYAHSLTSDTTTSQWTVRRPINPFVHRPLVNLLFCDGRVEAMDYRIAWGAPYRYGDPANIWDNK
jgi:prepilin-type processing-associated H-X9-DG protein